MSDWSRRRDFMLVGGHSWIGSFLASFSLLPYCGGGGDFATAHHVHRHRPCPHTCRGRERGNVHSYDQICATDGTETRAFSLYAFIPAPVVNITRLPPFPRLIDRSASQPVEYFHRQIFSSRCLSWFFFFFERRKEKEIKGPTRTLKERETDRQTGGVTI